MSNKLETCKKCGEEFYCDKHHLLPKGLFGEGETDFLCPNCHREFHKKLGYKYLRKENKQSMEFYFEKYFRWLAGLTIIGVILFLTFNL